MLKSSKNKIFLFLLFFFIFFIGFYSGPVLYVWNKFPAQKQISGKAELLKRQLLQFRNKGQYPISENIQDLLSSNQFIISAFHQIKLKKIDADQILKNYYDTDGLPGGYTDTIDSESLIITNGIGDLALLNINNYSFTNIDSNLNEIVSEQNYKGIAIPGLRGRFGLRDIIFDSDNKLIYVSLFLDISGDGCYGMGVLKAKYDEKNTNTTNVNFSRFFSTSKCNRNFNGHASGGRLHLKGENLIMTVGSYDMNLYGDASIPQDVDTAVGKVISINPDSTFDVLSLGHRNQHGLEIVNDIIFISEHGPMGGDELNIIADQSHYGWPFYTYGFDYDYVDKFKMPHVSPYKKPAYYFSPSIGISQLIFYQSNRFSRWNEKFIISSLVDKSIYIMDYDFQDNRFISAERIEVGHRIRDIVQSSDGRIFIITDDQIIIEISSTVSDI